MRRTFTQFFLCAYAHNFRGRYSRKSTMTILEIFSMSNFCKIDYDNFCQDFTMSIRWKFSKSNFRKIDWDNFCQIFSMFIRWKFSKSNFRKIDCFPFYGLVYFSCVWICNLVPTSKALSKTHNSRLTCVFKPLPSIAS